MGPFRKAPGPMDMGFMNFEAPGAPQPVVPAPAQEEQPFYKDSDTMAMMLAQLSNGLGGMTLRGKSGMSQMNNAVFANAKKSKDRNKSMKYLEENNPALHAKLMQLPEGVREQYLGHAFKAMFADPKDSFKVLGKDEKEALGLPVDGNFKMNTTTGEVSGVGNGGTTINNNMPGNAPTPKAGFQNVFDENNNFIGQEVIPGGPADLEQQADAERVAARGKQKADAGMTVVQDLQRSLDLINEGNGVVELPGWLGGNTGIGEVIEGGITKGMAALPRTDANAALGFAQSAKANIGLDQLQLMRETSPTGGALGQVPVQQQIKLESLLGSLDPTTMRPEDYRNNASRAINIYLDLVVGNRQERADLIEKGILSEADNEKIESMYKVLPFGVNGKPFDTNNPPPGFEAEGGTRELWNEMNTEERLRAWNESEQARVPQFYLYD